MAAWRAMSGVVGPLIPNGKLGSGSREHYNIALSLEELFWILELKISRRNGKEIIRNPVDVFRRPGGHKGSAEARSTTDRRRKILEYRLLVLAILR